MTTSEKLAMLHDYCASQKCSACPLRDDDGYCGNWCKDDAIESAYRRMVKNTEEEVKTQYVVDEDDKIETTPDLWPKENPYIPEEIVDKLCEAGNVQVASPEDIRKALEIADMVNHPGHYESGQFECIDVMEETQGTEAVLGFCICNAFKYLYRHNRKNGIEDVKKARWYIDKYISIMERDLLMADRLEDK